MFLTIFQNLVYYRITCLEMFLKGPLVYNLPSFQMPNRHFYPSMRSSLGPSQWTSYH